MSTPTGNVYLQVYNKSAGKFVEIPENVGKLSFLIGPTGDNSFIEPPGFSGFYFSRELKVNGSIELSPVNIGIRNITGSGSNASVNIGMLNNNYITNLELATGGYIGNYNYGYANSFNNSLNSHNFGYFNYASNNQRSLIVGAKNINSGFIDSLSLGTDNYVNLGNNFLLLGTANLLDSGRNTLLIGSENIINDIDNNLLVGDSNQILQSTGIENFGSLNYITGTSNLINFGDDNSFVNSVNDVNFGNSNIYNFTYGNFNVGIGNTYENSYQNIVIGNSNFNYGTGINIFGESNTILGNSNNIYGNNNSTNLNDIGAVIFGDNNNLSGTTNSSVFGSKNTLDQEVINLLYQVELTGITGAGPTLFTGVTGYAMLGGYKNIPGSGGNNNFFIGNNNQTSLNQFSYILGDSNQVLNNSTSYVFGSSNYLEKSTNSYAFGSNNSVSGFQNYVFGNNNVIRSGDYNSILIGISHEFTGNFKTASINIASVDSSIEVAPNEVKINSPSRMKFNNEHVIVASDINEFLDSSNGLSNSGSFGSYVINDPNYTNLADQIELQSFAYSGREDRYYGGFSGFNVSGPNAYNFTGFFRKQPVLYYAGLHSVYGDNFYQSNNQDFEILFSRDLEPVTGNWIISPKSSLGFLFYNKSTNTGIFPVSNWITTGSPANITKVTGYNPAPSFTYSSSFTGFSPNQKINSSTSYSSNYFNNFGIVTYPSAQDDIAVLYGNHTNPKNDPSWLIIDKYSSGVYYINKSVPLTTTPQTGWIATGYMGYTGRNPEDLTNALSGIKISLGTRSGIISSYDPTYGNIYIPFFY